VPFGGGDKTAPGWATVTAWSTASGKAAVSNAMESMVVSSSAT
jgi:hypothetical protein